jgi:Glycosyl transferase family 2
VRPGAEPLVSVIVTTCGRPDYLELALQSVVSQSYSHVEVLVCDDSPSPATRAVVRSLDDPRITYRPNATPLGIGANKMSGFRAATGDYVANLDDDDLWHRDLLATLVAPLEADSTVVLAFSGHVAIDQHGAFDELTTEAIEERYRGGLAAGRQQPFCRLGLVRQAVPMAVAAVLRKSAIDWADLPPQVDAAWDLWLTAQACLSGGAAFYVPERLASYRVHASSTTAGGGVGWHRSTIACLEEFLKDERLAGVHPELRRRCAAAHTSLGLAWLRTGERRRARRCFRQAFRCRPHARAMAALALSASPWVPSRMRSA